MKMNLLLLFINFVKLISRQMSKLRSAMKCISSNEIPAGLIAEKLIDHLRIENEILSIYEPFEL